MKDKKSLVVIDSFALIFRAYYAYPPNLRSKDGTLTNAVYGVATLLLDVLTRFKPSSIVAVYDSATPTIRASEFVEYKAQRKETDPELIQQIPMVQQLIESFDIPVLRVDGYEADDVIATIVKKHQKSFDEVVVVTGDQDLFQLIEDNVQIYLAGRTFSKSKLYAAKEVKEKLGITPSQVPDYKGLCGDPSDNIPGVSGIGSKSAQQLIEEFGSIEEVYKNIDKVPKRMYSRLVESYEIAIKSKELATVVSDVPISFSILDAEFDTFNPNDAEAFLKSLDINSLVKKVHKLAEEFGIAVTDDDEETEGSIGLFETPKESEGIPEENFTKGSLVDLNHIYLLADFEDQDSPISIKIKTLYTIDKEDGDVKKVKPDDLLKMLEECLDHKCTIVTCGFKELMHCAINLGFKAADVDKLEFEDLGFISQISSFGSKGHEMQYVFDQSDIEKPRALQDQLALFPKIFKYLNSLVLDDKSISDIYELEKSILSLVIRMEQVGIILDLTALEENQKSLEKYKQKIVDEIYEHSEMEFNINSPKQVGEVLFDKLGLPNQSKTKSGAHSTNERTLSKLIGTHPIIELILSYREVDKLLSTYISALPQYVAKDGRIHATSKYSSRLNAGCVYPKCFCFR
jgi:DNA polymerase-1